MKEYKDDFITINFDDRIIDINASYLGKIECYEYLNPTIEHCDNITMIKCLKPNSCIKNAFNSINGWKFNKQCDKANLIRVILDNTKLIDKQFGSIFTDFNNEIERSFILKLHMFLKYDKLFQNLFSACGSFNDFNEPFIVSMYDYSRKLDIKESELFEKEYLSILNKSGNNINELFSFKDVLSSEHKDSIINSIKEYKAEPSIGVLPIDVNFDYVIDKDILIFKDECLDEDRLNEFLFVYSPKTVTLIEI